MYNYVIENAKVYTKGIQFKKLQTFIILLKTNYTHPQVESVTDN